MKFFWMLLVSSEVFLLSFGFCYGLNVSLNVSEIADIREDLKVNCSYNLNNETLQSLKFYVSGSEIFRFIPSVDNKIKRFNSTKGIFAKGGECSRQKCIVRIKAPFGKQTVKCEASSERPHFFITSQSKIVHFIAEPQYDPVIVGYTEQVTVGDIITLNCTTDLSMPPSQIYWYINGALAEEAQTSQHMYSTPDEMGLRKSTRSLRLHVKKTSTTIKCVSAVKDGKTRRSSVLYLLVEEPHISMYTAGGKAEAYLSLPIFLLSLLLLLIQLMLI